MGTICGMKRQPNPPFKQSSRGHMRTPCIALLVILVGACHHAAPVVTTPLPQTVLAPGAPGPISIPCDTPVVVKATTDHAGVEEERAWLTEHYPGHSRYNQSLGMR